MYVYVYIYVYIYKQNLRTTEPSMAVERRRKRRVGQKATPIYKY
jgi:hypothetical protein